MRSLSESREVSGYRNRPQDFESLIRILDAELRLITPTGREAADSQADAQAGDHASENAAEAAHAGRYYQLTHDYLVQALREWLPRKQQETRRGQAALLLASRVSHWKNQRENRFLPSAREYLVIRILTNPRDWTDLQKTMMRRARHVHLTRGLFLAIGLAIGGVAGLVVANNRRAEVAKDRVHTLLSADIKEVPEAIEKLADYRPWADSLLLSAFQKGEYVQQEAVKTNVSSESPESHALRVKFRAALALSASPAEQSDNALLDYLFEHLLNCDSDTFSIIRDQLLARHPELEDRLWSVLDDQNANAVRRFHAARALAVYNRDDSDGAAPRWKPHAAFVAESMVETSATNLNEYDLVVEALKPASRHLIDPLTQIFRDPAKPESRWIAAIILAKYAAESSETLADLLVAAVPRLELTPKSFDALFDALKSRPDAAKMMIARLTTLSSSDPARGWQTKLTPCGRRMPPSHCSG